MTGEPGHARQHLLQGRQGLLGRLDPAMVEQQAQGRQLHALGGQRLVDFMGQGGGHLSQCRQLG